MEASPETHIRKKADTATIPETPQPITQRSTQSQLPVSRVKPTQDEPIPNLPDTHHLVLTEYQIAISTFDTRFLSMGVLLIQASSSYSDLVDAIRGRASNWEDVPLRCREKSIAVRWEIGQMVYDDSYDTVCGPDVVMDRLIFMTRERGWRDRLIVVYHVEENDSGDDSEPKVRKASPIL
ncbi:14c3548e-05e0-43ad-b8d2-7369a412ee68 [Sclerotinia trifoliorum]|uniref:14c3548e-05e0-43ad-b8d2-7369a412ee68 n=1 Tax=Sclerotinia trifoliorum TaxID=28548 RepID=A0A8H2W360_9HELO|nr:14c3548e-05e0-43ad-b8d2-7369a412ee68 [Sclerotinia trifoliorum]